MKHNGLLPLFQRKKGGGNDGRNQTLFLSKRIFKACLEISGGERTKAELTTFFPPIV